MAEEQIDKLTIEIESVGGDDKQIAAMRKQLEKLGKVDLSGTIKQLGNLRAALGYLSTVDDSVKSMLDNMTKLGLRASSVTPLKKQLDDVAKSARQSKEEIAEVIDQALKLSGSAQPSASSDESPRTAPIVNPKAYGYDQSAIDAIDRYAEALDSVDGKQKDNAKSAREMGDAAKEAGDKAKKALDKTNDAAKKTQKTTSSLAKTFSSIIRYRVVGTILQEVTQSAKEGTTALGEFDAEFKETLNTYSAASKAMGGGLAISLAPALEAAAPLIEYIADGIGSIGNGISMISALLSGDDEYRKVKSVEKIKEELAAAEEKAANVKHLISGFDELNLFQNSDTDDTDIDIYEWVSFTDELGKTNSALLEDLATLGEFITVAGVAAAAVALLKNWFGSKNKTLKEQTKLTKEDSKVTEELGETVSAIIPSVVGVFDAFGLLGGLKFPVLDSSGVTVPANEASDSLDDLGTKNPAPEVNTAPLLNGIGVMGERINDFVLAEYPGIVLSADDRKLLEDMQAAAVEVTEFADGFGPAFEAEYEEIGKGYNGLIGDMLDVSKETTGGIETTFSTAFNNIEEKWGETLGDMLVMAFDAFNSVELMWDNTIESLQFAWNKAFSSGLTVNVNTGTTETAETTSTSTAAAERKAARDKTIAAEAAGTLFRAEVAESTASPYDKIVSALTGTTVYERTAEFEQQLEDVGGALEQVATSVGNALKDGISLGSSLYPLRSIGLYAGGGLVTSGEFFMARENGMPEFIGQFGNQTGVANNEQIVSGIAGGVESVLAAYIPQIISAIEENAATVNIGDDQIARAASRGAAKYQRVTGRSMF